ncbi:type VI secretion protein [Gemmatimonadetes bacterium T265]|nr:type VI secretion protein [Gemmatimonadetes bacterium T265]
MRQMQPVLWTKGVLLTPQHLQTQDRFLEDQLAFRLATLAPDAWGMHRLQIDREALAAGRFALTRAAAIFPDGLLYDAPGADALPPPRPVEPAWDADRAALDVYLAIAEQRAGGHVTSDSRDGHGTRYTIEVVMRRDETTGLAERPVQLARKNVRLLFDGEPLEGSAAIRVARVRRGAAGAYELDPAVVPPLVDLAGSDALVAMAQRLAELLASRSAALATGRRQRNQGLAEFGAADVAPFWLLYTVNSFLPVVRHLAETRRGHPETLYATMLSLAGALATFAPDGAAALPAYDHGELGRCFGALDARVRELLQTALPTRAVSLPLRPTRASVYAAALDDDRYLAAPQLYLAVAADVDRPTLLQRVPQLVKVCSADGVDALIRQALPGVPLAHAPVPAAAVPVQLEYQYFSLNQSGPAWDAIRRSRTVAAYVPADVPNPRLELVVVLPDGD